MPQTSFGESIRARDGGYRHNSQTVERGTQDIPQRHSKQKNRRFKSKQLPDPSDDKTIVNLSNKILSDEHKSILRKGLSFIPTPKLPNHIHSLRDTLLFTRRIRLNEFFDRNPIPPPMDNPLDHPSYPKKERSFNPNKGPNLQLEKFISDIEETATNYLPNKNLHSNLTLPQWQALKDLRNDKSIIIKPADKGGALVILNTNDYIEKCMAHLDDSSVYERLPTDPTQEVNNEIKNYIQRRRTISLPEDAHLRLVPKYPRTAEFYILPKIHKPGAPGRPIVSANECPTEIISKIVDQSLKPLAMRTPSYIRYQRLSMHFTRYRKTGEERSHDDP